MVVHIAGIEVTNNGREHYPGLEVAADQLKRTLNEIKERAQHYNQLNDMAALLLQHTISNEIQSFFVHLDSCLKLFLCTADAMQAQWIGEFRAVQERELGDIRYLKNELEKMNVFMDVDVQNTEQVFAETSKMAEALEVILDDRLSILQAQATTPFSTFIEAQRIVRTILSVSRVRIPSKPLLGQQCTLSDPLPIKAGVTCDVYQASFLGGVKVAKKVFRLGKSDREWVEEYAARFSRVTSLWSELQSDFILPFYGFGIEAPFEGENHSQLYTISPLMSNFDAITDAAMGLQYLHNHHPPVVHSGVRGDNILITDGGGGLLGGFGLSRMMKLESIENPTAPPVLVEKDESHRWLAPEIFTDNPPWETPSDVWGWGMAALEIISGSLPYHQHRQPMTIIIQINKGPPSREDYPRFNGYAYRPDEIWQLLEKCWSMDPSNRPTMDQVVTRLQEIARLD